VNRPYLKRFLRLPYVPGAIFEASELFQEGEGNFADWSVALFRDNQFCFTFLLCPRFLVFFVNFWAHQQSDQVCVLLDGSGFAQIAQPRLSARSLFRLPIQLGDNNDWNV